MLRKTIQISFLFGLIVVSNAFAAKHYHSHQHHKIQHHKTKHTAKHETNKSYLTVSHSGAISPEIEAIIAHYASKRADVGIVVKSLSDGSVLYQKNANSYMTPASTLKTVTAATALLYLGPDYQFDTKIISSTTQIQNRTLYGDVYFKFDGDPTLTKENVARMVTAISDFGIDTIRGNIYIDDTVFDQDRYGQGWDESDFNKCFAAPTTGIVLDKNCFSFEIKGTARGSQVLSNEVYVPTIYNNVITKPYRTSLCPAAVSSNDNNEYDVSGCLHPNSEGIGLRLPIKNVRLFTEKMIIKLLRKNNIGVYGSIGFAKSPQKGYILTDHKSEPLNQIVRTMLKHSDNQIADSLFKKIGYYYFGKGSWANSATAEKQLLASKAGIDLTGAKILDGAGLSRYDAITPNQLMQVISFAYSNPQINGAFINSLPISGIDGSLHWRMGQKGMIGRVHAKTGTETGISGLAGYINTQNNKKVAFVIMFNALSNSHYKYKWLEDKICTVLCRV